MLPKEIINKASVGDKVYVVKQTVIRWNTMRFENTNIIYGTYIVEERLHKNHNGTTIINRYLSSIDLPKGTKTYSSVISERITDEYQCFFTPEEAEIWKVVELQDLEKKVEDHIEKMRLKTIAKIKKLKQKEKLALYLDKYPDQVIKVL